MNNHVVYWYHLAMHTDPCTEGYIGVTNDITRRNKEHMRNSNNLHNHFYNAIEYYGKENIILTILYENLSEEQAYNLENIYRPEPNIGWNYAIGGNNTLYEVQKKQITVFHESNPEKEYTFESITEAAKQLGLTIGRLQQAFYRKHNVYGLDGWAVKTENTNKKTIKTISQLRSELFKNKPKNYVSKFKGMKGRWTDEQKKKIGSYHKGKIISEKQKEIVRQKNRHNTLCKQITLVHNSNPNKTYTFFSISEASRQLNISLSCLKSKCLRPLGSYGKNGWAIISLGSQDSSSE